MKYAITSGEYSDFQINEFIDGEGDLIALFNEFRELLMPGVLELFKNENVWGFVPMLDEAYNAAYKKAVELNLIERDHERYLSASDLANMFTKWLVREKGFTYSSDVTEFYVALDNNPHPTVNN